MKKTALITGITGQDGAYLAAFLLKKGYTVHGLRQRSATPDTQKLDYALGAQSSLYPLHLHDGDMTDPMGIHSLFQRIKPDEVYHLAAQTHVHSSFALPAHVMMINALGTTYMLEAIRQNGLANTVRFYQASSSEMYGPTSQPLLREHSPFNPCSPYAISKVAAHYLTKTYRQAYGLYAVNGILFNHESPLRGEDFVTRKVTKAVAAIHLRLKEKLVLGHLDSRRDWGHAQDYVEGMWLMLQQPTAEDYVLATGESYSVRHLLDVAFAYIGKSLLWKGKGEQEKAIDSRTGKVLVEVDPALFRPNEVPFLKGDARKARETLGWKPKTTFAQMIHEMMEYDLGLLDHGYTHAQPLVLKAAEDAAPHFESTQYI